MGRRTWRKYIDVGFVSPWRPDVVSCITAEASLKKARTAALRAPAALEPLSTSIRASNALATVFISLTTEVHPMGEAPPPLEGRGNS